MFAVRVRMNILAVVIIKVVVINPIKVAVEEYFAVTEGVMIPLLEAVTEGR